MQKAFLYTEDGKKKDVYILDEKDAQNIEKTDKKKWKEHLYSGYLIVGTIAFILGIVISIKRLYRK